jgi:hypothetical protein
MNIFKFLGERIIGSPKTTILGITPAAITAVVLAALKQFNINVDPAIVTPIVAGVYMVIMALLKDHTSIQK